MATLKIKDGSGNTKYLSVTGAGTELDPFVTVSSSPEFIADETNLVANYLENGGSSGMTVDGSTTPVSFSYSPPTGKQFIAMRLIIYMEGPTDFDSNQFGSLAALSNGWKLVLNGTETMIAKTNRELVSYMFDAHGSKIFGKEARTLIGRLSLNKITETGVGVTIREGESIAVTVNDDLRGLTYLEVRVQGTLKDV